MSCLVRLLTEAGQGVEAQLKPQLEGLFGGVVRSYLPQRWVFETDDGTATLGVEKSGAVWAKEGADADADVLIRIGHEKLAAALRSGSKDRLPPGPVSVTPRTQKGKTAFEFTRKRLGL